MSRDIVIRAHRGIGGGSGWKVVVGPGFFSGTVRSISSELTTTFSVGINYAGALYSCLLRVLFIADWPPDNNNKARGLRYRRLVSELCRG
jgi:hypothetical protein